MTGIRPGCRSILLVLSLLVSSTLVQTGAVASDRDTPAYRIYVDPETGRYTTTPPDQRRQGTAAQATNAFATGATTDEAPTGTNLRRPFTAALLLVLIAAASLPIRSRHTDQPSESRSK